MSCPHVNTQVTITRESRHEVCDDCGEARQVFATEPLLKDGACFLFRAADFKAAGDMRPRELVAECSERDHAEALREVALNATGRSLWTDGASMRRAVAAAK